MAHSNRWEEISIAIDGVAGAGKSTIGRALAAKVGLTFFDTGSTYRALALRALRLGMADDDGESLGALASTLDLTLKDGRVFVAGDEVTAEIRTAEVSSFTSKVATVAQVRSAMVAWQRNYAESVGGVVGDGRDCGTVVLKEARLKVYLDAAPEVRASRRGDLSLEAIKERDLRDSTRSIDPLTIAEGAVVVDTSKMSIDESVSYLYDRYLEAIERF
ncbi:MAG: (d)CMP kinase [Actinomycetota bacterium]|nr:(d)CMP kinase [Actinomycetota bacterium]